MGWLVKNIFAFAILFFCCDFSSTHRFVYVRWGWELQSGVGVGTFVTAQRKTEKMANDFRE